MPPGTYLRRKRSVSVERTKGGESDKRRKSSIGQDEEKGVNPRQVQVQGSDVGKTPGPRVPSIANSSSPTSSGRQIIPSSPPPVASTSTAGAATKTEGGETDKASAAAVSPRSNGGGRLRLTRQLFDQIPFLESDPLKALEVLKKMVQESGLETLYASVNENTSRARDFADRIAELKKTVDGLLKYMLSGRPSDDDKLEKYREMKTIWAKIHGLNEAKVKLTQNAYDMVDRVIRRLDKELESIVNEIGHGKASTTDKAPRSMGQSSEGPSRARVRGADFDMPVDPNEPTYCECKQISFGEMIACDNVNCPIEWFHFACVGLTSKPKGKWFCKRCVANGQNKLGKKKKSRLGIIEKYASASDKSEVEHILSASDSD